MSEDNQINKQEMLEIHALIDRADEMAYYDLDEVYEEEALLKAYLKTRSLIPIESKHQVFLIDKEALKSPINLNCFECTKKHQYGCCCGSPCTMSSKNTRLFGKHEKAMEEHLKHISQEEYEKVKAAGGFVGRDGKIKEYEGRCAMLVSHEGVYKCLPHKYALENEIPIYDLCPLSCIMYPLEIIELVQDYRTIGVILTAAIEEEFAKGFSRWGGYDTLDVELRCLSPKAHDELFKEEAYQPVYQVNKGLICHEFGTELYEKLKGLLG